MIIYRLFASLFLVLSCIAGVLFAQTYQYSHEWTNGKKRALGMSTHEAVCQLQRLKIILEGKNIDQLYWPCDWQKFPTPYDVKLQPHGNQGLQPLASPSIIDDDNN